MQTYSLPISVKGIVFDGDSVWLRKNERNEWELPGGKIDEGEQPAETVTREMREELGFQVKAEKVVHAHVYTIQGSPDESHGVLVLSYLCRILAKGGEFEICGEAGNAEFQKFTMQEISTLLMPDFYREAINSALSEITPIT